MPASALFAAASAIPGPQQAPLAVAAVFTNLFSQHPKDAQRIKAAQDALTKALAGDASALAYMQQQAVGSATQVGKDAFKAALQAYAARATTFQSPISPLQAQLNTTSTAVAQDIAAGVQNIGAGATTALSNKIAGNNNAVTVPLTQQQLMILGAVAVLIIFLRK